MHRGGARRPPGRRAVGCPFGEPVWSRWLRYPGLPARGRRPARFIARLPTGAAPRNAAGCSGAVRDGPISTGCSTGRAGPVDAPASGGAPRPAPRRRESAEYHGPMGVRRIRAAAASARCPEGGADHGGALSFCTGIAVLDPDLRVGRPAARAGQAFCAGYSRRRAAGPAATAAVTTPPARRPGERFLVARVRTGLRRASGIRRRTGVPTGRTMSTGFAGCRRADPSVLRRFVIGPRGPGERMIVQLRDPDLSRTAIRPFPSARPGWPPPGLRRPVCLGPNGGAGPSAGQGRRALRPLGQRWRGGTAGVLVTPTRRPIDAARPLLAHARHVGVLRPLGLAQAAGFGNRTQGPFVRDGRRRLTDAFPGG